MKAKNYVIGMLISKIEDLEKSKQDLVRFCGKQSLKMQDVIKNGEEIDDRNLKQIEILTKLSNALSEQLKEKDEEILELKFEVQGKEFEIKNIESQLEQQNRIGRKGGEL